MIRTNWKSAPKMFSTPVEWSNPTKRRYPRNALPTPAGDRRCLRFSPSHQPNHLQQCPLPPRAAPMVNPRSPRRSCLPPFVDVAHQDATSTWRCFPYFLCRFTLTEIMRIFLNGPWQQFSSATGGRWCLFASSSPSCHISIQRMAQRINSCKTTAMYFPDFCNCAKLPVRST